MTVSFVAAGTVDKNTDVATLSPGVPTGTRNGDLMVLFAAASQAVAITTPTGYTLIRTHLQGGCAFLTAYKVAGSSESAPSVPFAANATKNCGAQIATFRGVDPTLLDVNNVDTTNAGTANIGPLTGLTPTHKGELVIYAGTRRSAGTGVATLSGDLTWHEISEIFQSPSGIGLTMCWDYAIDSGSSPTAVAAKTFTVTGGSSAAWIGQGFSFNARPSNVKLRTAGIFHSLLAQLKDMGIYTPKTVRVRIPGTVGAGILKTDVGDQTDPTVKWGQLDAQTPGQYEIIATGGDTRPQCDGTPQGNTKFMRMTVNDGDNPGGFGERVEVGYNSWKNLIGFWPFFQGDRRQIYESLRLPSTFPLSNPNWQVVTQLKPCGPSHGRSDQTSPAITLEARNNRWNIVYFGGPILYSLPATKEEWWRISWDVFFSNHDDGWVDVTFENEDGSINENSGKINCQTLSTQDGTTLYGGVPVIFDGDPIPATLRCGIYHNPVIPGSSIDVDNVQVAAATPVSWSPAP